MILVHRLNPSPIPPLPGKLGERPPSSCGTHLEVRKVFRHEIVDLADRQTPRLAVFECHEDQDAVGREGRVL